jgi:hypothetical protein
VEQSAGRDQTDLNSIELLKEFGETGIAGLRHPDEPAWQRPKR